MYNFANSAMMKQLLSKINVASHCMHDLPSTQSLPNGMIREFEVLWPLISKNIHPFCAPLIFHGLLDDFLTQMLFCRNKFRINIEKPGN